MSRQRRILALSPHPDDESIGCGGTLCKHADDGDLVHVAFLTSGEKGGHGRSAEETVRVREREARAACRVLGVETVEFLRQPDGAVRATARAVEQVRRLIRGSRPDLIYVPHDREMHPDHRAAVRVLLRAEADGGAAPRRVRPRILMFEVWTPLQQIDEIIDISPFVARKRKAIRSYRSQCAVMDFEAAAVGLNRYRGEMHSWPGGDYAEVFAELRR